MLECGWSVSFSAGDPSVRETIPVDGAYHSSAMAGKDSCAMAGKDSC